MLRSWPAVLAARSRDLPPCPWRTERERQLSVYIRAGRAGVRFRESDTGAPSPVRPWSGCAGSPLPAGNLPSLARVLSTSEHNQL